jgi:hypothetical protein
MGRDKDTNDISGIFTKLPRQDLEALIVAAVPNGGVALEEYPFEASTVSHDHLNVDWTTHNQREQIEAIRSVLRNAFDAANAQRSNLAIEIAYW